VPFASGVCVCDEGFIDVDCAVDKSQPPDMLGIPDDGLCDLSQRECARTAVRVRQIVESESLTCRLRAFQVTFVTTLSSLF